MHNKTLIKHCISVVLTLAFCICLASCFRDNPSPPVQAPPAAGQSQAGQQPAASLETQAAQPPEQQSQQPSASIQNNTPTRSALTGDSSFSDTDLSIFIYAVNAPGLIRVNGQEFKIIKEEPDMQYNINAFGTHFRKGSNSIEIDLAPRTGEGRNLQPKIHMKISMGNAVLGDWEFTDKDGLRRTLTVEVPEKGRQ